MKKTLVAAFAFAAGMVAFGSNIRAQQALPETLDLPVASLGDNQSCGVRGNAFIVDMPEWSILTPSQMENASPDAKNFGIFQVPLECYDELKSKIDDGTVQYLVFDGNGPAEPNISIPVYPKSDLGSSFVLERKTFENETIASVSIPNLDDVQTRKIGNADGFAFKLQ